MCMYVCACPCIFIFGANFDRKQKSGKNWNARNPINNDFVMLIVSIWCGKSIDNNYGMKEACTWMWKGTSNQINRFDTEIHDVNQAQLIAAAIAWWAFNSCETPSFQFFSIGRSNGNCHSWCLVPTIHKIPFYSTFNSEVLQWNQLWSRPFIVDTFGMCMLK